MNGNHFQILEARTPEDYRVARSLIEEYQTVLNRDLCFQGFAQELEELPKVYGPPKGELLILMSGTIPCGCVGLREFSPGVAEMKRMYVKSDFAGKGGGRLLGEKFIELARNKNYKQIVLDTVPELERAITLYRNLGFQKIPPYRFNPDPTALFLGLHLATTPLMDANQTNDLNG